MTPANITALQTLVQADSALAQQLQSATNEAAAELLAKASSQKGLAVDAHAIADYLKISQAAEITDDELEAVAGGQNGRGQGQGHKSSRRTAFAGDGKLECVADW